MVFLYESTEPEVLFTRWAKPILLQKDRKEGSGKPRGKMGGEGEMKNSHFGLILQLERFKPTQHLAQMSNLNQINIWQRNQYLESE